jgi:cyclin-dependent kinase 2
MAFMMLGKDLFRGDSNYGQIMEIFQLTGTPTPLSWPAMVDLKYYNSEWPKFSPKSPAMVFPHCNHPDLHAIVLATLTTNPDAR